MSLSGYFIQGSVPASENGNSYEITLTGHDGVIVNAMSECTFRITIIPNPPVVLTQVSSLVYVPY